MLVIKEGTNGFEGTDAATREIILKAFEKEGLTVRTAEQDQTYLAANSQKAIDDAFKVRNQQLEDTIKEMTGVEKANAGEKYYDYFKRAIKVKSDELATLQTKVKEYEEKGTSGNVLAEEYKKQVTELQNKLKIAKEEFDQQLEKKNEEMFNSRFQLQVDAHTQKIATMFRGDIGQDLVGDITAARIAEFKSKYKAKDVEGNLVFYGADGKPVLDKVDGRPRSLESLLTEVFTPYIDAEKQKGGAGSGKPNGGGNGGQGAQAPKWKEAKLPDNIKSKVKLVEWLEKEMKLPADSKEFTEATTHFSKLPDGSNMPLRD